MPAPDPHGLYIEEYDDGRTSIIAEVWYYGNRRNRLARMSAVARKIKETGWRCPLCRRPVPLYSRADARFCSQGCRKKFARLHRKARS